MIDESEIRALPLPIAQLIRRSLNAKTPLGRHQAAFYAWEVALKLMASLCIVAYATLDEDDQEIAARHRNLLRPSLGHWWEFVRTLLPPLADQGVRGFPEMREVLLGKAREDFPRAAGLDALLAQDLGQGTGARTHVKLTTLFDRLVRYRNRDLGHGAAGQRSREFYRTSGNALQGAVVELFTRMDPVAGRDLIYVDDVRRLTSGEWLVEQFLLRGETARRIESLTLPSETQPAELPHPQHMYVKGDSSKLIALHPLLVFEPESAEVFFLNARRGKSSSEYLCYSSGRVEQRDELGAEQRAFLGRLLGTEVKPEDAQRWIEETAPADAEVEADDAGDTQRIGDFEILSKIGQGGMGIVYRARQPSLNRQVALKCLSRLGDPKSEERFAREIAALGRVDHPSLVKIFSSGADGDRWFYAMELVEGTNLATLFDHLKGGEPGRLSDVRWIEAITTACAEDRSQETPVSEVAAPAGSGSDADVRPPSSQELPPSIAGSSAHTRQGPVARIVALIQQVAEATHALHEAGIVHRDIKPGNIMLTADGGHAVLMDLGLAQLMDDAEGRLTRTHQFVGTLRYASPEQVLAVERLDGRADVYSLGATLWELLTLRPVLGATEKTPTPELMKKIQWEEPERPSTYNPRVTTDLDAIVLKCMEKQRERRYGSARELVLDLTRWLEGEPVSAQPPTFRYFLGRYARKHKRALAAAALGVVGLVALVTMFIVQLRFERDRATTKAIEERAAREEAVRLRDSQAAELRRSQALRLMLRSRTLATDNPALSLLLAIEAAQTSKDGESASAIMKALANLREQHSLSGHGGGVSTAAFSPRGDRVLTVAPDGIRIWGATGALEHHLRGHAAPVYHAAFGPDGTRAVTVSIDAVMKVWDVESGSELLTQALAGSGPAERYYGYDEEPDVTAIPRFHPDGRRVVFVPRAEEPSARIVDLEGRRDFVELEGDTSKVFVFDFSPDGQRLATGSGNHRVQLFNTEDGSEIPIGTVFPMAAPLEEAVTHVAFVAGGQRLVAQSGADVLVYPPRVSGRRQMKPIGFKHYAGDIAAPFFSPDGQRLVSIDDEGLHIRRTEHHLDVRTFPDLPFSITAGTFLLDGRRIALGSERGEIHVIDIGASRIVQTLTGHEAAITSIRPAPDGETLLTASADGTAKIWSLDTRPKLPLLAHHEGSARDVRLSSDGRYLVTPHPEHEDAVPAPGKGPGLSRRAELWDVRGGLHFRSFLEHSKDITSVVVDESRKVALTTSRAGSMSLWDATTGRRLKQFVGGMDEVTAAGFSRTGPWIVAGCANGEAWVWNTETEEEPPPLAEHDGALHTACFNRDGSRLLTCSPEKALLWAQSDEWEPLATLSPDDAQDAADELFTAAFRPDGRLVVTTSAGGAVIVFDAEDGELLNALPHSPFPVFHAAFAPSGAELVTVSADHAVRVWDAEDGRLRRTIRAHGAPVFWCEFSPSGRQLVTASADGTARVFDTRTWNVTRILSHREQVLTAHFDPGEQRIATVQGDGSVRIWNLDADAHPNQIGPSGWPADFAFGAEGQTGIRSSSNRLRRLTRWLDTAALRGHATIWDLAAGRRLFDLYGEGAPAPRVAFAPTGDRVLVTTGGAEGRILDPATWADLAPLETPSGAILHARFTPDGKRIVATTEFDEVFVWDAGTGRRQHALGDDAFEVQLGPISPSSKRLLTFDATNRAHVWDLERGISLATIANQDANLWSASFSPDDRLLAAPLGRDSIQFWKADTGEEAAGGRIAVRALIRGGDEVGAEIRQVAFAPRGDWIAVGLSNGGIHLVQGSTREPGPTLRERGGPITHLAFSAGGDLLATGSEHGIVRLWSVADRREIAAFEGHIAAIESVAFSADGQWVVSADHTGIVRVWPVDPLSAAIRAKPRAFTPDERERFQLETGGGSPSEDPGK